MNQPPELEAQGLQNVRGGNSRMLHRLRVREWEKHRRLRRRAWVALLAGISLGTFVGLLLALGLQHDPVVATVAGSVMSIVMAWSAVTSDSGDKSGAKAERKTGEETEGIRGKLKLMRPRATLELWGLLVGFGFSACAALLVGTWLRAHNGLSPSVVDEKAHFLAAGFTEDEARLLALKSLNLELPEPTPLEAFLRLKKEKYETKEAREIAELARERNAEKSPTTATSDQKSTGDSPAQPTKEALPSVNPAATGSFTEDAATCSGFLVAEERSTDAALSAYRAKGNPYLAAIEHHKDKSPADQVAAAHAAAMAPCHWIK